MTYFLYCVEKFFLFYRLPVLPSVATIYLLDSNRFLATIWCAKLRVGGYLKPHSSRPRTPLQTCLHKNATDPRRLQSPANSRPRQFSSLYHIVVPGFFMYY